MFDRSVFFTESLFAKETVSSLQPKDTIELGAISTYRIVSGRDKGWERHRDGAITRSRDGRATWRTIKITKLADGFGFEFHFGVKAFGFGRGAAFGDGGGDRDELELGSVGDASEFS